MKFDEYTYRVDSALFSFSLYKLAWCHQEPINREKERLTTGITFRKRVGSCKLTKCLNPYTTALWFAST